MPALSARYAKALVTGASGGLGGAFVEMLLREGVAVWGTARDQARLDHWRGRAGFSPLALDLLNSDSIEAAYAQGEREAGRFDLIINNAAYGIFSRFTAAPFAVWRDQITAALTGTAQIAHRALGSMRPRGQGGLVNVSSVAVDYPLPFMTGYNIAKAGLSALSESLIFETRGSGVCVIDFRPGDYRTPFNQSMQLLSSASRADADPTLSCAWQMLEKNLAQAPEPSLAARDLRQALRRGKSGTVYSGSWFQTKLAPLFARVAPAGLRRAIAARYFGVA